MWTVFFPRLLFNQDYPFGMQYYLTDFKSMVEMQNLFRQDKATF